MTVNENNRAMKMNVNHQADKMNQAGKRKHDQPNELEQELEHSQVAHKIPEETPRKKDLPKVATIPSQSPHKSI